jgi:hypothetical protein
MQYTRFLGEFILVGIYGWISEWICVCFLSYEGLDYENSLLNHIPHCKRNKFRPQDKKTSKSFTYYHTNYIISAHCTYDTSSHCYSDCSNGSWCYCVFSLPSLSHWSCQCTKYNVTYQPTARQRLQYTSEQYRCSVFCGLCTDRCHAAHARLVHVCALT